MCSRQYLKYLKEYYFSNKFFSLLLRGFRKEYSTQYALVNCWHLLIDLSKAYGCVNHELIIAKLAAYGLNTGSVRLIQSYLSKRKQRIKINSSLSEWIEIIVAVIQGSILGSILVKIFIHDLLLFIKETDVCNFADNATLYKYGRYLNIVSKKLERDVNKQLISPIITKWWQILKSFSLCP